MDIPQLMVEFVLVILKDLISIKTHVKKNPHQLNPHQHAQLETTISKCEIELTNL